MYEKVRFTYITDQIWFVSCQINMREISFFSCLLHKGFLIFPYVAKIYWSRKFCSAKKRKYLSHPVTNEWNASFRAKGPPTLSNFPSFMCPSCDVIGSFTDWLVNTICCSLRILIANEQYNIIVLQSKQYFWTNLRHWKCSLLCYIN